MRRWLSASLVFVGCAAPVEPRLEVTPPITTLVTGQVQQLTVTRQFPSGPVESVSQRVIYTAENVAVVTVGPSGLVIAQSEEGSSSVRVVDPDTGASASVSFTVRHAP